MSVWLLSGKLQTLTCSLKVKFPRFNEIVSLTLPDGTERSGQVLEARGMLRELAEISLGIQGLTVVQGTELSYKFLREHPA